MYSAKMSTFTVVKPHEMDSLLGPVRDSGGQIITQFKSICG